MKVFGTIIKTIGIMLVALVLLLYLPISLPSVFGYTTFGITSGSMSPAIDVGDIVYVKQTDPKLLEAGDIIVYIPLGTDCPVTHRVQENARDYELLVTKGDANATEDLEPVRYDTVAGKVRLSIPLLGYIAPWISSRQGKTAMAGILLGAAALILCGNLIAGKKSENVKEKAEKGKNESMIQTGMIMILLAIMIIAGLNFIPKLKGYKTGNDSYEQLEQYVDVPSTPDVSPEPLPEETEEEELYFPWEIEWPNVDFKSLKEINPNIVAWIYLEGPEISYPVVRGNDNDFYLHHDIYDNPDMNGSIFLDCRDDGSFSDRHNIIYGHHMADGSMFAQISKYKSQEYYDEHPIGLLITPDRNYVIEFFTGYVTPGYSYAWNVDFQTDDIYDTWLEDSVGQSMFKTDVAVNSDTAKNIVTLVTCSYEYNDARFALVGILRPEPDNTVK